MDVKSVSMPTPTPAEPAQRSSEQQPTRPHHNRLKDQEVRHTARAFGAHEVINAQGRITDRLVNVTA